MHKGTGASPVWEMQTSHWAMKLMDHRAAEAEREKPDNSAWSSMRIPPHEPHVIRRTFNDFIIQPHLPIWSTTLFSHFLHLELFSLGSILSNDHVGVCTLFKRTGLRNHRSFRKHRIFICSEGTWDILWCHFYEPSNPGENIFTAIK